MKTETQIAQENTKRYLKLRNIDDGAFVINLTTPEHTKEAMDFLQAKAMCFSHKATCQRFLEFFESIRTYNYLTTKGFTPIIEQITDLKQAIKLYEDTGI